MELKQLEYFRTICETKNITKAAELLYLSRQSLSVSMKKLEDELEVPLFIRKKEGICLTKCGEIFYEYAKNQEALFAACQAQLAEYKKPQREVIRLGLASGLHQPDGLRLLFAYEQQNPLVSLEIIDICTLDFWSMLQEGTLDIAYSVRPPVSMNLKTIPLYQADQWILLGASNPLAAKDAIDFTKDLRGQTLLETESRMSQYAHLLHEYGIRVKMVQGDPSLLKAMLSQDKGCVITLPTLIEQYAGKNICVKPLVNMPPKLDLNPCLVYRPDLSAGGEAYLRYLCRIGGVDIIL